MMTWRSNVPTHWSPIQMIGGQLIRLETRTEMLFHLFLKTHQLEW
jgi:hypothetical protein